MKFIDERQLLPVIRDAINGGEKNQKRLTEAIGSLFEDFISKGEEKDEYKGWTFDLTFIKSSNAECDPYMSAISSAESSWTFFPKGKDDCAYAVYGKGVIKIHCHGFLWRM